MRNLKFRTFFAGLFAAALLSCQSQSEAPSDWEAWKLELETAYGGDSPTAVLKNTDYRYLVTGESVFLTRQNDQISLSADVSDDMRSLGSFLHKESETYWKRHNETDKSLPVTGPVLGELHINERYTVNASLEHVSLTDTRGRIMLFDQRAPAALDFKGFSYFPYDPDGVLAAKFVMAENISPIILDTERGLTKRFYAAGAAHITINGAAYAVPVYSMTDQVDEIDFLFSGIRDDTNGVTSYGIGRYIVIEDFKTFPPETVTLDLNRLYNPSCAHSDAYNCPIIPFEIEASLPYGESYDMSKY